RSSSASSWFADGVGGSGPADRYAATRAATPGATRGAARGATPRANRRAPRRTTRANGRSSGPLEKETDGVARPRLPWDAGDDSATPTSHIPSIFSWRTPTPLRCAYPKRYIGCLRFPTRSSLVPRISKIRAACNRPVGGHSFRPRPGAARAGVAVVIGLLLIGSLALLLDGFVEGHPTLSSAGPTLFPSAAGTPRAADRFATRWPFATDR